MACDISVRGLAPHGWILLRELEARKEKGGGGIVAWYPGYFLDVRTFATEKKKGENKTRKMGLIYLNELDFKIGAFGILSSDRKKASGIFG